MAASASSSGDGRSEGRGTATASGRMAAASAPYGGARRRCCGGSWLRRGGREAAASASAGQGGGLLGERARRPLSPAEKGRARQRTERSRVASRGGARPRRHPPVFPCGSPFLDGPHGELAGAFYRRGRSVLHQNISGDRCSYSSVRRQGDNAQRRFIGHARALERGVRGTVVSCRRYLRKEIRMTGNDR